MAHKRHTDRQQYFDELTLTSEKYFAPFIESHKTILPDCSVLEIGCGEGGNLLPFAKKGCKVTGIDLSETRIDQARTFFSDNRLEGTFIHGDIFTSGHFLTESRSYDIIIIHDVIEHVMAKKQLLEIAAGQLRKNGVIFVGFPPWQMPFGGHQQIARTKIVSTLPFLHLLPCSLYRKYLKICGETLKKIDELLDIKACGTTVEMFKEITNSLALKNTKEVFYFINPHYETKFGLKPRILSPLVSSIKGFRNYFTTSYFCLLTKGN